MEMRPIGNSGIEVAPIALGGNVFDWTADEGDQLRRARRVRRRRRDDDRHRRRLFGLGAGASGRRERGADRPLAEARSGQARQDRHRDQGRDYMAGLAPGHDRAVVRRLAGAAGDRHDRPLLPAQGRRERAAGRQPRRVRRSFGRPARSARSASAISPRRGSRRRWRVSASRRLRSPRGTAELVQPRRARASSKGRCATSRCGEGLAFFPYYSLANGFLTGKYRSKDDPRQEHAGLRSHRDISTIAGRECYWRRWTRSRPKPARRWRPSRWPGSRPSPDHRPDRQRDEPRASKAADRGAISGVNAGSNRSPERGKHLSRLQCEKAPGHRGAAGNFHLVPPFEGSAASVSHSFEDPTNIRISDNYAPAIIESW